MGCGENCVDLTSERVKDWQLADPHGMGLEGVRIVRDEIEDKIKALIQEIEKSSSF